MRIQKYLQLASFFSGAMLPATAIVQSSAAAEGVAARLAKKYADDEAWREAWMHGMEAPGDDVIPESAAWSIVEPGIGFRT